MKKIIIYSSLLCILNILSYSVSAQVYIRGKDMVPFDQVASSAIISKADQLSLDNAFTLLTGNYGYRSNAVTETTENNVSGQYFKTEKYIVKIVAKINEKSGSLEILEKMKKTLDINNKTYSQKVNNRIIHRNSLNALVSYDKRHNKQRLYIFDKTGKYYLAITVYSTQSESEIIKAEAFMDTLMNSITFK